MVSCVNNKVMMSVHFIRMLRQCIQVDKASDLDLESVPEHMISKTNPLLTLG